MWAGKKLKRSQEKSVRVWGIQGNFVWSASELSRTVCPVALVLKQAHAPLLTMDGPKHKAGADSPQIFNLQLTTAQGVGPPITTVPRKDGLCLPPPLSQGLFTQQLTFCKPLISSPRPLVFKNDSSFSAHIC